MTLQPMNARLPLVVGFTACAILFIGVGVWATRTEIAGAVVTTGVVKVENDRQVVQHADGGVVAAIHARDGDVVAAGDLLLELDGTYLRSELADIERQLAEMNTRRDRLEAERDGRNAIRFNAIADFSTFSVLSVRQLQKEETALFDARLDTAQYEETQIDAQQVQIDHQIQGFEAQLSALQNQLSLVRSERDDVRGLFKQGLVQKNRMRDLHRSDAELSGEIGRLQAQIAEAKSRSAALEFQKTQLKEARREGAIVALQEISAKSGQLLQRRLVVQERLGRLRIVSPVDGTVHGSRIFAEHAVLTAAEPALYIVPSDQPLHVAARIDPLHIDQVYSGQDVTLVFSSFSRHSMPEGSGEIQRVSADTLVDGTTGAPYFEAIVSVDEKTYATLGTRTLQPGMPVDVFAKTDTRTPLSYVTQPVTDHLSRAFREE